MMGAGMSSGRFRAGKAEHHALVAGALPALEFLEAMARDALVDVRRLGVDGVEDGHGLVVDAVIGIGVADILDHVAGELLDVDIGIRGDLAADEDHARGGIALAGDMAFRVIGRGRRRGRRPRPGRRACPDGLLRRIQR